MTCTTCENKGAFWRCRSQAARRHAALNSFGVSSELLVRGASKLTALREVL